MKRIACACILAFFCLACGLSARAAVAVNGSMSALIGADGQTIVEPGAYSRIINVAEPSLFAAKDKSGKFALMDARGGALTEHIYTYFEAIDGVILYACGESYGVMDAGAQSIVPCEYSWIVPNGAGGYLALRTDIWDDSPDGVYYIDETGYVTPTGVKVASFLMPFSEGLSPALSTENGRYGYLNAEGQWEIRPQYAYADGFINGMAVAMLDSGSGVIDITGGWLVTPKYDFISIGEGENALILGVNYGQGIRAFRGADSELLYALSMDTFGAYVAGSGNTLFVYAPDHVYVMNASGETLLTLGADALIVSGGSGRMIAYDGEWGDMCAYVLNESGERLSPGFQDLEFLTEAQGKAYYVFSAFDVKPYDDARLWGAQGISCGLIDETGREILPARYHYIDSPAEGYAFAEDDKGMYLYDLTGAAVWAHTF